MQHVGDMARLQCFCRCLGQFPARSMDGCMDGFRHWHDYEEDYCYPEMQSPIITLYKPATTWCVEKCHTTAVDVSLRLPNIKVRFAPHSLQLGPRTMAISKCH